MLRTLRRASSQVVSRVIGSRFAKPVARLALAAAGLLLLAFIGSHAVVGALASTPAMAVPASSAAASATELASAPAPAPAPAPATAPAPAPSPDPAPSPHTRATPDDPVILNTATIDDFRRLPGVGEKRATAAVALRTRLGGRFHAVEDLLKVKGIGRTTLRRLRPLIRLDPPPLPEAGTEAPR